jgi:hypothetical protein
MTLSHLSQVLPEVVPVRHATLEGLITQFEETESLENPDAVVPLRSLRMTDGETVAVPAHGSFRFTDWSKQQCAQLLGVRWDRWFATASSTEQAEEINRRLWRNQHEVRLRTSRVAEATNGTHGVLRALVTPGYSPIEDSRVAHLLASVLRGCDPELRIVRSDVTDRSTTYVVGIGRPFRGGDSHEVGDVWGGLLVRNSGVGFASLTISVHLTRLLCKNGMTAPLPDAVMVRRAHRGLGEEKLRDVLMGRLTDLPLRFREAGNLFRLAEERRVEDVRVEVTAILRGAGLPRRNLDAILQAWEREPRNTAFAVSQAVTRAAQGMSPELRFDLERAAGAYLSQGAGSGSSAETTGSKGMWS